MPKGHEWVDESRLILLFSSLFIKIYVIAYFFLQLHQMLVMKVIAIPWILCTDLDPFWCQKLTSAHLWIMAPHHLWAHSEHQDMEQEELLLECVLIFNQIGNCDKSMLLLAVRPQGPLQGVKEQVSLELFQV